MKTPRLQPYKSLRSPWPSRVLAILNSAFFLWTLTAIFVTLGGSYFAASQRCIAESDKYADTYEKLSNEIGHRKAVILRAIDSSNNLKQLKDKMSLLSPRYSEFRDKSLFELLEERQRISVMLDFEGLPISEIDPVLYAIQFETFHARGFLDFIAETDTSTLTDDDLKELKAYAKYTLDFHGQVRGPASDGKDGTWTLDDVFVRPNCSIATVLNLVLGRRAKILGIDSINFSRYEIPSSKERDFGEDK